MDLKETGCEEKDWIHVALSRVQWRALVSTGMDLRIP
jgi:hypothetical protein